MNNILKKLAGVFSIIPLFLVTFSSCDNKKDFSAIIMADLHYDSTAIRELVLDSIIDRINNSRQALAEASHPLKFTAIIGDLTDTGSGEEWNKFKRAFGINGEGEIKIPVYETYGNHDGNIDGAIRSGIVKRNKERNNISAISENGLHYSWNEGNYHFISLGSYPGMEWDPDCEWCHYFKESFRDPQNSLQFLKDDLANNLKNTDQKVVLFFHYGWDDFSLLWWTEEEQENFYNAIRDYNISMIFHGHDHQAENYKWKGIDVWSAGSPQRGNKTGNYLLASFTKDSILVSIIEL